jgi:hypothetical protein
VDWRISSRCWERESVVSKNFCALRWALLKQRCVCVCVFYIYIYIERERERERERAANISSERPWTPIYVNCSMWICLFDQNFKILNWQVVARLRAGYWRCGAKANCFRGAKGTHCKFVLTVSKILTSDCSLAYTPNRMNVLGTGINAAWPIRGEPSSGYAMSTAAMPNMRLSPVEIWWHTVTHGRGSKGETGEWSG